MKAVSNLLRLTLSVSGTSIHSPDKIDKNPGLDSFADCISIVLSKWLPLDKLHFVVTHKKRGGKCMFCFLGVTGAR